MLWWEPGTLSTDQVTALQPWPMGYSKAISLKGSIWTNSGMMSRIGAMSGGGRVGPDSYLVLAQKLGAIRTFCKPFDRDEMLGAINEVLSEGAEKP